jgi:predicted dinucleotide-binding enzyme
MKIGIIGAGNIGGGLGKRWLRAGHQVMFGSRDAAKARQAAAQLGASASGGTYAETAAFADVLVLSVPWGATEEIVRGLGDLSGKIIVETTNNFVDQDAVSTTERVSAWASGAKVVKAFNTIFAAIINSDVRDPAALPDVFLVGDDAEARRVVAQLCADAGFNSVDFGPAKNARHVENLAFAIVELGYGQGQGTNGSFKLVKV